MTEPILREQLIQEMRQGRVRRVRALIHKESLQILRDPSSLLISLFLPVLLLFLYGFGVSLDLNHVPIGLVLEDTAPDARSFAQSLTDSSYFDVKVVRDRRQLQEDLTRGAIRGIVVIPSYFSQFRSRPDQAAPIQVIADGSETNTANFVQNYVQGAFENWLRQEKISVEIPGLPLITSTPRFWYNPNVESRLFLLSGSLAIIMTLIGSLLTALVVAREWERGTMESMIVTPVSRMELILGKAIPYFGLGMASMALCVFLSVVLFGLPLRGSIGLLALASAAFLFCALSFGLMISTLAKNQALAFQIAMITAFLPAYILSGFLFEISSMPAWIRALTYIIPAKYFVQCLETLFLVGNIWDLVLPNLVPMIGIGMIFLMITVRKTSKRLTS